MKLQTILTGIGLLASAISVQAQHQELQDKPELWKARQEEAKDTNSLVQAFRKGEVHGHFRYFFMATNNTSDLTDYYAHAAGGGIKFETARFHGFQLGISGFFIFNIGSSDFEKKDPKTNQLNRYELGLFDITDPANRKDIDRLEELFLRYNWKQSRITVGKQLINTPFINLQDGRMRPTEVGAIYTEIQAGTRTRVEGGYVYEISPRSTVQWYKTAASVGIYPQGVNPDGSRSDYAGNLKSKGILLGHLTHKLYPSLTFTLSELFTENIFNSLLLQVDYRQKRKDGRPAFLAGIQYIRQDAVHNGGNLNPAQTFFTKGGQSNTFGLKAGLEAKRWDMSVNYTRITAHGRYLMPREWGREPFFTFLPRERNEGLGDVHAAVLKGGYKIPKANLKLQVATGYYKVPAVTNYALNKYNMPSYFQANLDIRYEFKGLLKGLDAQCLFVYKGDAASDPLQAKTVINKVNMSQWNLLLNYRF